MKKIFEYQLWHAIFLVVSLVLIYWLTQNDDSFLQGSFLGIKSSTWIIFSLASAILHQIYVLIAWRSELYYKWFTKRFNERGFVYFKIGFALLILSRPATIICLAIANRDSISLNSLMVLIISILISVPVIYLMYSVRKYFGINRAFGIDHFYPEKYNAGKIIKQGIFKYSSNAMYVYGFLGLWLPGLLLQSKSALLLAGFSHLYIWVHYYCTELADMKVIYGQD